MPARLESYHFEQSEIMKNIQNFIAYVGALVLMTAFMPAHAQNNSAQDSGEKAAEEEVVAIKSTADENILHLDLSTGGRVTIKLFPNIAPNHVKRIQTLARQGFYNNHIFHRVIDGFMAQTGDPTGTGRSGSTLPDLKAEFNNYPHIRGVISMARTDEDDSANSQFFIMFNPRFSLDRNYTAFGRVTSGMQFVDAINRGEPPINPSRIIQASLESDKKPVPNFAAPAATKTVTVDDLNAPLKP